MTTKNGGTYDKDPNLDRIPKLSQAFNMADSEIIELEENGFTIHGIFSQGSQDLRSEKPLIVLIHGGGTNATYFDNEFFS